MLDDKTIIETIKQLIKSPTISFSLKHGLESAIDPDVFGIYWCVDDLEHVAKERESYLADGKQLYDRTHFRYALARIIDNHDAEYGIGWESLEWGLEEYCKIEEEEN